MFAVGEYIIYGSNGVCIVESIGPSPLAQSDKDYYTLRSLNGRNTRFYTPVDSNKVAMRTILGKEELQQILEETASIEEFFITNEKEREGIYQDALKSCDCRQWLALIKTICKRRDERLSQGKKSISSDERFLKMAEDSLFGEIEVVLGLSKEEIKQVLKGASVAV